MLFSRGNSLRRWSPLKTRIPPLSVYYYMNSKRRTQNPSKSLKKPLLRQKDDYIPQVRQSRVYLTLLYKHTQRYIAMSEANGKSSTFTIKYRENNIGQTHRLCGPLWLSLYSRLPITRTFKGNREKFKLSGVRVTGSLKQIIGSNTGRKNGFTNVCERCKYVVNLELQICITFALSAKVWANTYICQIGIDTQK